MLHNSIDLQQNHFRVSSVASVTQQLCTRSVSMPMQQTRTIVSVRPWQTLGAAPLLNNHLKLTTYILLYVNYRECCCTEMVSCFHSFVHAQATYSVSYNAHVHLDQQLPTHSLFDVMWCCCFLSDVMRIVLSASIVLGRNSSSIRWSSQSDRLSESLCTPSHSTDIHV